MKWFSQLVTPLLWALLSMCLHNIAAAADATVSIAYSEEREPCALQHPLKQAYFGDFHVHTRYSLDAATQDTRTTPDQAYRFAQGEKIGIQPWRENGTAQRSLQLSRPLDFAMVSDHAELIGEVYMCTTPEVEGHGSWQCLLYRYWPRGAFYLFNYMATMQASHMGQCGDNGELCLEASLLPWREMQEAAEAHYDRSSECSFTTFVGYEWTGMQADSGGNLHRNVVFRNAEAPELPVSFIDGPSASQLWSSLDAQCNAKDGSCDSLIIPHNSNLSAGYMFSGLDDEGGPMSAEYAATRQRFEPLTEIMQHKGSSECYFAAGITTDELCAFEQLPQDNIAGYSEDPKPDTGFLRKVLRDGMLLEQKLGVNPYQFGIIASTDTHLGTPGAADEDRFLGHGGAGVPSTDDIPPGLPDKLEYNPGGLAVVWAEENSRDALFNALRRKETYGTSGPRIVSRFFSAWDYPEDLCESPDLVAKAYATGVPMGSELPPISPGAVGPARLRPRLRFSRARIPALPPHREHPCSACKLSKAGLTNRASPKSGWLMWQAMPTTVRRLISTAVKPMVPGMRICAQCGQTTSSIRMSRPITTPGWSKIRLAAGASAFAPPTAWIVTSLRP